MALVPAPAGSHVAPRRAPARKKWIPNGDTEFLTKAHSFAQQVGKDPSRLGVSQADSDLLLEKVAQYRARLQEAHWGDERGPAATRRKEEARREAEEVMRRLAHMLRAREALDDATRIQLGLPAREASRPKPAELPDEPPELRFVRALHEANGAVPVHELRFKAMGVYSSARPRGAARLELFVDLVPPEEPIPAHPGANLGGRPWYLRSYTRSPILLTPPMARVPMRVVYWGRWADAAGNVGPFSATAVGWIEGGSHLPALAPVFGNFGRTQPLKLMDETGMPREDREPVYVVAVMEAQYDSMHRSALITAIPSAAPALPAPDREPRRLEGPSENLTAPAEAA